MIVLVGVILRIVMLEIIIEFVYCVGLFVKFVYEKILSWSKDVYFIFIGCIMDVICID